MDPINTSLNSMNTARFALGSAGTQTAVVAFGGNPNTTATELWNGTSWSSNPTGLSTGRQHSYGAGTQTAALAVGGQTPTTFVATTEAWTGTQLQTKTVTVS